MGRKAAIDEKFTIAPFFCSTIGFINTCVGNTVPVRFRLSTFWNSSTFRSKKFPVGAIVAPGILPPAAFSNASTRSYLARISFRFCPKTASSSTLVTRNIASPPFALISFTIAFPTSALRPKITTLAPSSAK